MRDSRFDTRLVMMLMAICCLLAGAGQTRTAGSERDTVLRLDQGLGEHVIQSRQVYQGVQFGPQAGSYRMTGPGRLVIGSQGMSNIGHQPQVFDVDIELSADQAWTFTRDRGGAVFTGRIDLAAHRLTFNHAGDLPDLTFKGPLRGRGSLTLDRGRVRLLGDNSDFAGTWYFAAGSTLDIDLEDNPAAFSPGSTLHFAGMADRRHLWAARGITCRLPGSIIWDSVKRLHFRRAASFVLTGDVQLQQTMTIALDNGTEQVVLAGTITGPGGLADRNAGPTGGMIELSGTADYRGPTDIYRANRVLHVTGILTAKGGPVVIHAAGGGSTGGRLDGDGIIHRPVWLRASQHDDQAGAALQGNLQFSHRLIVDSTDGSGNVTMLPGGLLTGRGQVGGNVTLHPGSVLMPGTDHDLREQTHPDDLELRVAGNVDAQAGSELRFQLGSLDQPHSRLHVAGDLRLGDEQPTVLSIINTGQLEAGRYTLMQVEGQITGLQRLQLDVDHLDPKWHNSRLEQDGNRIVLVATVEAHRWEQTEPVALFLTWQRDPTTTMTIDWQTEPDAAGQTPDPVVQYQHVNDITWQTVTGTRHRFPFSKRTIHRVELTGLEPAGRYRFRFPLGQENRVYQFRTMPTDLSGPIRVAVGGDTRHRQDWMEQMNRIAMSYDPDFALWAGDLAYADGLEERVSYWYEWFDAIKNTLVDEDGRVLPVVMCIGNHEVRGGYHLRHEDFEPTIAWRTGVAPYFYGLFAFPGHPGYRALDFGDYLSLIMLDSGHTNRVEDQAAWLEQTLADRQHVPHVLPVYHVAAFASHSDYYDNQSVPGQVRAAIRRWWVPLFEKYGVRVAFEAHDHAYKRTYPIRDGRISSDGVVYIGDGAWGVRARSVRDYWYLRQAVPRMRHFVLMTLQGSHQHFLAIGEQGQVIDQYPEQVTAMPARIPAASAKR